jgi:hypothetical protein
MSHVGRCTTPISTPTHQKTPVNSGKHFMPENGLDKPFCEQPVTVRNAPIVTLDQLVLVRIQVRQLIRFRIS